MTLWKYFAQLRIRKKQLSKLRMMQSQADTQPIDTQATDESQSQRPDTPCLEVLACLIPNSSNYRFVEIRSHEFSVGRHGCDYNITADQCGEKNVPYISKRQCLLRFLPEADNPAKFRLENVGTNPVFVNGAKVKKGQHILLGNDDTLAFGKPGWKAWKFGCNLERWKTHPAEVNLKYIITGEIGNGAHGVVFKAFDKLKFNAVALKVLKLSKVSQTGFMKAKDMVNEINVMKKISHPNVVRIIDVVTAQHKIVQVYLAMEFIPGGDLFGRLEKGRMSEATAKFITFQIAQAIQYLHSKDITHRDIKPENILLMSDAPEPIAKLTDFGLSKYAPRDVTDLKTFCGTMNYVAPEILRSNGKRHYTQQVDVWSLGVVLFVCLVGYPPFSEDHKGNQSVQEQITAGNLHMKEQPKLWSTVTLPAQELVRRMLTVDPLKRITVSGRAGVLDHFWFSKDVHLQAKYKILADTIPLDEEVQIEVPRLRNQDTASVSSEERGPALCFSATEKGGQMTRKRKNDSEKENEIKRPKMLLGGFESCSY